MQKPRTAPEREQPLRRRSLRESLEDHGPWKPHPYELADATAIQAIANGTADSEQQRRALRWIVECADTYGLSYRPGAGGDRDTAFAEGKRSVGLQLVKLVNLNVGKLRRSEPLGDPVEPKS